MPFCVIFSQWHNVYEFDDSMNMYYLGLQAAKGYLISGYGRQNVLNVVPLSCEFAQIFESLYVKLR